VYLISQIFSRKGAKPQRKPALKRGSALRLCAFAREILPLFTFFGPEDPFGAVGVFLSRGEECGRRDTYSRKGTASHQKAPIRDPPGWCSQTRVPCLVVAAQKRTFLVFENRSLGLTAQEKNDLVEYLKSLPERE
jgi:hypothetical protein